MTVDRLVSDVDEVLTTTRAVRRRLDLDRPVSRSVIEECLRIAQQAPMSSNQEHWRFIAVDDPAVKEQIADLYRQTWIETVERPLAERDPATVARLAPAERENDDDQNRQRRIVDGVKFLVDRLERVPVLVIIASVHPVPKHAMGARASGYYGTVFPAAWSLALSLRSRGLGSVMATGIVHKANELSAVLGLPDYCHPVAMLPVAYTKGLDFKPAPRADLDEVMNWNGWSARLDLEDAPG